MNTHFFSLSLKARLKPLFPTWAPQLIPHAFILHQRLFYMNKCVVVFSATKVNLNPAVLLLWMRMKVSAIGPRNWNGEHGSEWKRTAVEKSRKRWRKMWMQDLDRERKPASPPLYSLSKFRTGRKRRKDQRDEWRSVKGWAVKDQKNGKMTWETAKDNRK